MRDTPTLNPVAEDRLIGVLANGDRVEVWVAIGSPYQVGPEEWACPVRLTGLHGALVDPHGRSSLQALCLAASLLRALISSFVEKGGRMLYPGTNDDFDIDSCFSRVGAHA